MDYSQKKKKKVGKLELVTGAGKEACKVSAGICDEKAALRTQVEGSILTSSSWPSGVRNPTRRPRPASQEGFNSFVEQEPHVSPTAVG